MICPKCGEEYEDDMQCCLWCDAPNPNYGRVEEAECKVGSVQKRNQGEINGFDYLEHSDEVDFAQRTSGYVVLKIAKFEFVKTVVGMLFCLGPFLFFAAMFFVEEQKSLWPLLLLVSGCFAFYIFVLSRTVLAVKWYKDKFVLKTLYGETELSFDKSVFAEFGYEDDKGFSVCLKKGKWIFVLREKAFSFDKSELQKTKRDEKGALKFFFKKDRGSFVVDERVFPEVAAMMKTHYGVE